MIRKLTLPLTVAVALGVGGCDDGATGVTTDAMMAISGPWQAQSFTYMAEDDPDNSVDLMDFETQLSLEIVRTSETAGTFAGTAVIPLLQVEEPTAIGGEVMVTGDNQLFVDFDAATNQLFDDLDVSYEVTGTTLTWTTDGSMPTDPNVPAALTVVLVKAEL